MGRGDNRLSRKVRQRRSLRKHKERIARAIAAGKEAAEARRAGGAKRKAAAPRTTVVKRTTV